MRATRYAAIIGLALVAPAGIAAQDAQFEVASIKLNTDEAWYVCPAEQSKPFATLDICGGVRRQIAGVAPERKDVVEGVGVPMTTLLEYLIDETGRIVIDKTDFTEVFNFRLEFASTVDAGLGNVDTPASGLSIFTALEEQLGMRLRSTTGPVDVLVIDRVERPTAN